MDKILLAIQAINTAIGEFKGAVVGALKEVADGRVENASTKLALEARSEGLDVREAEIKKVEDIIALKEEGQRLLNEANAAVKELTARQQAFNDNATAKSKEFAAQASKNEHDRQANERETKALIETREQLEKEKGEFQLKLAKVLVGQANKL